MQLIKNISQRKLTICQNIYNFRLFILQNDCFSFCETRRADHFLFLQNSWVVHSSLWVTFWLTLQYLATLVRKIICVPATRTQAERVFSWMGWLLKKEGFVCHKNLSTCNYSWRTGFSFRLESYFTLVNLSFVENYHLSILRLRNNQ